MDTYTSDVRLKFNSGEMRGNRERGWNIEAEINAKKGIVEFATGYSGRKRALVNTLTADEAEAVGYTLLSMANALRS